MNADIKLWIDSRSEKREWREEEGSRERSSSLRRDPFSWVTLDSGTRKKLRMSGPRVKRSKTSSE